VAEGRTPEVKQLISIDDTPYYHIVTRCVRRAFLCGKNKYSGNCYEHHRKLIVDRIKQLAEVFNIDVCANAVMSNHYRCVLIHIIQHILLSVKL